MSTTTTMSDGDNSTFYLVDDHGHTDGLVLGFWVFMLSDVLLFAGLFATYAVLGGHYALGPSAKEVFNLNTVVFNTAVMLTSSLTCGFAMYESVRANNKAAMGWLVATGALGILFILNQVAEYHGMVEKGATPQTSAFLSSFFGLIGTHGLHVAAGVIWALVMVVQISAHGLRSHVVRRRLLCFSVFWNFLDIMWVCVFTFVYFIGVLR